MFQKAERRQAKLKIAITGPSGSGKTFSALRMAKGIGGNIAFIDTENGSASLYADTFDFSVVNLRPPFTTEKYMEAIRGAEKAGFHTLIIDSLTHAWAAEGGLLEQKEALDSRGKGNSYTNWASITKKHEAFKSAILQAQIHIITTMRSKQDYILGDRDGKQVPKKVGMAPIQRDGIEYEFTTVFDIAMDHQAEASKDRTGLFVDKIFQITEETGEAFQKWLSSAKDQMPSEAQIKRMFAIAKDANWPNEKIKDYIKTRYSKESTKDLTFIEYSRLCEEMQRSPVVVTTDEKFPFEENQL